MRSNWFVWGPLESVGYFKSKIVNKKLTAKWAGSLLVEWEHPGLGEDLAALVDSSSLRALALDGLEVTAAVVAAVAASVAAFRSAEVTVADLELPPAFLGKIYIL